MRDQLKAGKLKTGGDIRSAIKQGIIQLLDQPGKESELKLDGQPAVILVVGVNGAGKTTTVGKLAYKLSQEGAKVGCNMIGPVITCMELVYGEPAGAATCTMSQLVMPAVAP